jgi:hypothetical protein
MKRSQFCNKLLTSGIACGCTFGLTGSSTLASAITGKSDQESGRNETPCNEKMDFTQKWVKRFFEVVDGKLDEKTRTGLMQANGEACAKGAYGEITPGNQPASTEEIDQTISKWQQTLGKENIFRNDNVVYFNYVGNPKGVKISEGYCLCPMIENGPPALSPTYCQCSVGYVRYMFQKLITFKPVQVELLESLRSGGKACRFKVVI